MAQDTERDYLAEARRIVTKESIMLPQREHLNALAHETEHERMRLAACGAAAMSNTPSTRAARLAGDHAYFSASYGDVCAAVDREITHREDARALRGALQAIVVAHNGLNIIPYGAESVFEAIDAARALLTAAPLAEAISHAEEVHERGLGAALALAADHDAITPNELEAVDAQIDIDMIAMGRELKIMARRFLGLRVNVPAGAPAIDVPPPTPGQRAGLEVKVWIERHAFKTDPWWVAFVNADGDDPRVLHDYTYVGQFPTEEIARAAVDALRGVTIKEISVKR